MLELILGAVVILCGALTMKWCNQQSQERFGHSIFTKGAYMATAIAMFLLVAGMSWRSHSLRTHGDALNGTVVAAIGVAVLGYLVYRNIQRLGPMYGIGGSVLQLGVLGVLAWISLPFMALFALLYLWWMSKATPVYVVNR